MRSLPGILHPVSSWSPAPRLSGPVSAHARSLRLYFRSLMATGSLFLGIGTPGEIESAMELIPRRNLFLLYENF